VLMDQSSRDDTLVGVGPPRRAPGEAVSSQSSRDKRRKLSPRARHDRTVGPSVAPEREGRAISAVRFHVAVSLDGYLAGPDQSVEEPLGVGGLDGLAHFGGV